MREENRLHTAELWPPHALHSPHTLDGNPFKKIKRKDHFSYSSVPLFIGLSKFWTFLAYGGKKESIVEVNDIGHHTSLSPSFVACWFASGGNFLREFSEFWCVTARTYKMFLELLRQQLRWGYLTLLNAISCQTQPLLSYGFKTNLGGVHSILLQWPLWQGSCQEYGQA